MASGAPASRCSRSRAINAFFEKVRFLLGGGGGVWGPGLRTRGSVVNFYILGRVSPVLFSTGGGSQFVLQGQNYSMSLVFCIYKQSYLSRLI